MNRPQSQFNPGVITGEVNTLRRISPRKLESFLTIEIIFLFFVVTFCQSIFDLSGPWAVAGWGISLILMGAALMGSSTTAFMVLILFMGAQDITQSGVEYQTQGAVIGGSLWQLRLGWFTPGIITTLFICLLLIRHRSILLLPKTSPFLIYSTGVGIIGLIVGYVIQKTIPLHAVISTIRMVVIFALAGAFFYGVLHKNSHMVYKLWQFIIIVMTGRTLLYFIHFVAGYGSEISGYSRVSVDSTKSLVILMVVWGVYKLFQLKNIVMGVVFASMGILLIAVFMTRMNYLNLGIGVLVLVVVIRGLRALIVAIPGLIVVTVIGMYVLSVINPSTSYIVSKRFEMLKPLLILDFESADDYRYAEFVNCFGGMSKDGTIITGRGFGAYYTDTLSSLSRDQISAFSPWSWYSGKYNHVHNVAGTYILKYGIIGFLLWTSIFFQYFLRLFRICTQSPQILELKCCLLAIMPTVFNSLYWTSKGLVYTSMLLAMAGCVATLAPQQIRRIRTRRRMDAPPVVATA